MIEHTPKTGSELSVSWHTLHSNEVVQQLGTHPQDGLTTQEVVIRQNQFGFNQLTEKPRPSFLKMVISQFKNFIVLLLLAAAIISAILGDTVEAAAIMAIVVLNALLGVIQERRAEEALAALKKLAAPEAQVMRDGKRITVPSRDLVSGDLVFLEAGNHIPADIRLMEAINLRIEEAALTGESVPVEKNAAVIQQHDIPLGDRRNTAFMGTTVTYGRGKGIVVGIGMKTQLGLIAGMLQEVEEEATPLQKRLDNLGRLLGYGSLVVCALVFAVGLLKAETINLTLIKDMFIISISLAIAAVPEGLPAVVTISLALGMREMVHRHALIRRLASVETLGSATVICTDKTGTLTQNEMTVTRIWVDGNMYNLTGSGYSTRGKYLLDGKEIDPQNHPALLTTLWVGILNNDAVLEPLETGDGQPGFRIVGDPTEGSILIAAAKTGANSPDLNRAYPRVDEIPFDSTRKRMLTLHTIQGAQDQDISPISGKEGQEMYAVTVKGAPDVVLDLCSMYTNGDDKPVPLDDKTRGSILAANDTMTHSALRVLGLAYRLVNNLPSDADKPSLENNLVFSGLVGMIDPARQEVKPAIEKARRAGIRTIMITGDYPNTARAIAEDIGLLQPGHQVLSGREISEMDEAAIIREVELTDVFARVSPEHKMRIVDALRSNNEVVAMTGDGVNDAPAIKRADIGVAMGITGTDVAKETADMVLTDDNYASIVDAIEQGRIIYSNIRKFVYYLLSCNLAEIAIIFLSTLITGSSALTAIQILWLNLVTDGAPALALATEKGDPDIMLQAPRPVKEPIINRFMRQGIVIQTIAIAAVTLGAYFLGLNYYPEKIEFAETMAFSTLSISELLRAFTARSEYFPVLKIGVFGNKWMNYAVVSSLVMILVVIYTPFFNNVFNTVPLGITQWEVVLPLVIIPSLAAEFTKFAFSPNWKNKNTL